MPVTFIIAPIFLAFLIVVVTISSGELIEEKAFISGLSCSELKQYAQDQVVESKYYFGNEAYLIYAEELYSGTC
jgi:hypothetical protein